MRKGPVQLDLFEPYVYGYEFKVIVTNKILAAGSIVDYHAGRGSQENTFGELKTHCHMDYVPVARVQATKPTCLRASLPSTSFATCKCRFNHRNGQQIANEPPYGCSNALKRFAAPLFNAPDDCPRHHENTF